MARLKRGKKRRAIPNPNRRFMTLSKALAAGEAISEVEYKIEPIIVDLDSEEEEVVLEEEMAPEIETRVSESPQQTSKFGRRIIKKRQYE